MRSGGIAVVSTVIARAHASFFWSFLCSFHLRREMRAVKSARVVRRFPCVALRVAAHTTPRRVLLSIGVSIVAGRRENDAVKRSSEPCGWVAVAAAAEEAEAVAVTFYRTCTTP